MMNTIILYATKNGSTQKAAELLAERIPGSAVFSIDSAPANLAEYDTVVIGACIRMGRVPRSVSSFMKERGNQLFAKRVAFFINCGFVDKAEDYLKANFDHFMLKRAVCCDTFGAELDIENMKGFDKFVSKLVTGKYDGQRPSLLTDRIDAFAKKILDE